MEIVRASQNGPYITVKFEAKTPEPYEEFLKNIRKSTGSRSLTPTP